MSPVKKSDGLPQPDGTTSTNYGATFEISSTAIAVLRARAKNKEFNVWMNHKAYEPWDDIVIEIDEMIICVQLKHNEKFEKRKLDICLEQRQVILEKHSSKNARIIFVYFATTTDDTIIRNSYSKVQSIPDMLNLLLTNESGIYYDANSENAETYFCMNQHNISTEATDIKQALTDCIGQQYLAESHLKDIQIKFLDYIRKRYQRLLKGSDPLTKDEICIQLGYAILNKFKIDYKPSDAKVEVLNNLTEVMEKASVVVFNHRWSSSFGDNIWNHLMAYFEEKISKKHLKQSKIDDLWMEGKIHMPIVSPSKEMDKVILRALEISNFTPKVIILRPRIFRIIQGQDVVVLLQNLDIAESRLEMQSGVDKEIFKYAGIDLNTLVKNRNIKLHQDAFCKIAKDYSKGGNIFPNCIIEAHDEFHYLNDANTVGDEVMPALFAAIKIPQIDIKIIQQLIQLGADTNASVIGGFRPVGFAIDANRPDILEMLLVNGANPDPADKYGMRPLFNACIQNKAEMVKILVKYGSDRNTSDINGVRPLFMAYDNKNFEIMRILLEGFDKPAAANTQGIHILHKAAEDGNVDCLQCILDCCPNIKIFMTGDVMGKTPLDIARDNDNNDSRKFVEILENALKN